MRIWLELDLAGETLAGLLHEDDRPPRAFFGWLELATLVEEARERVATPETPGDPDAGADDPQLGMD